VVGHADLGLVRDGCERDIDGRTRPAVLARAVQKLAEDLGDAIGIAADPRRGRRREGNPWRVVIFEQADRVRCGDGYLSPKPLLFEAEDRYQTRVVEQSERFARRRFFRPLSRVVVAQLAPMPVAAQRHFASAGRTDTLDP
jgi:hypothetical protein